MNRNFGLVLSLIVFVISILLLISSIVPQRLMRRRGTYIPSYGELYPFVKNYIETCHGSQSAFSVDGLGLVTTTEGTAKSLDMRVTYHVLNTNEKIASNLVIVVSPDGTVKKWRGL